MASDWRRAWTNNQWFESEVDGFARRHGQIALMPAGAVLERTIIDYQWQWRYGPTTDFDSRHFETKLESGEADLGVEHVSACPANRWPSRSEGQIAKSVHGYGLVASDIGYEQDHVTGLIPAGTRGSAAP